jgi:AcrR family transcriptional regulator
MHPMAGTKQFDEEQVLERALECFWRHGYGATSMQDLAQATGVLRGSLYHAYGDKRAIFLKVYERYRARFLDKVREAMAGATAEEALRRYFVFAVGTIVMSDPDHDATRGCLTTKTATDETAMDESIRQALRLLLDGVRALIEERLSRPDAQGQLALPPAAATALIVTATRGMVVMERIYRDRDQLQTMGEDLLRLLVPGAVTTGAR